MPIVSVSHRHERNHKCIQEYVYVFCLLDLIYNGPLLQVQIKQLYMFNYEGYFMRQPVSLPWLISWQSQRFPLFRHKHSLKTSRYPLQCRPHFVFLGQSFLLP